MLPYLHSQGGVSHYVSPFAIDISLYSLHMHRITTLPILFFVRQLQRVENKLSPITTTM